MKFRYYCAICGVIFCVLQTRVAAQNNVCSDAVFLRRATIATTGRLPLPVKVKQFLQSSQQNKREALVDELLNSEAYAKYLTMRWGDILRIKSEFPSNLWPNGVQAYNRWIYSNIANNTPYNIFVKNLLLSKGSNFKMPAANFYRAFPAKTAVNFNKNIQLLFLGTREPDTNSEIFFSQLKFKSTKEWKEEIVFLDYEMDGLLHEAVLPGNKKVVLKPDTDWRETYVNWLTSESNNRFASVMVNRLWYWFMGKGLVNSPDDWGIHNPLTDSVLLSKLTSEFISNGYNVKQMIRKILLSNQFQSTGFTAQRLLSEVLVDALSDVTGVSEGYKSRVPEPFSYFPDGTRAVDLGDATVSSSSLELFGRSSRDVSLESQHANKLTDRQVLYLLNSSDLELKIRKSPVLDKICEHCTSLDELFNEISCLTLGRYITPEESKLMNSYANTKKSNKRDVASDLLWMYINSTEFLYQH